jgi:hypothetical protein
VRTCGENVTFLSTRFQEKTISTCPVLTVALLLARVRQPRVAHLNVRSHHPSACGVRSVHVGALGPGSASCCIYFSQKQRKSARDFSRVCALGARTGLVTRRAHRTPPAVGVVAAMTSDAGSEDTSVLPLGVKPRDVCDRVRSVRDSPIRHSFTIRFDLP